MKLLSLVILLSSIIFTFNYVWINRIHITNQSDLYSVLLNKWTGNYCVFYPMGGNRILYQDGKLYKLCSVNENGKIELP